MNSILQRLNFFLVETMHIQTSAIIRQLIKEIYDLDYKKSDFYLIDCVLTYNCYPMIFSDKIYNDYKDSLHELIINPPEKELKETSDLFKNYKSSYEFNSDILLETLKGIANTHGRLRIHEAFFLWFYEYYDIYQRSVNILMEDKEDSIPDTWKYYLAIMAVSTIRCEYLLRELELQFLVKGGDINWLNNGLSEIPSKLKKLEKINNILAHQPWTLKIQDLNEIYVDWQKNELVHAVLILTNFHRLSCLVESFRFNFDNRISKHNLSFTYEENTETNKLNQTKINEIILSELKKINNSEKSSIKKKEWGRKNSEENLKVSKNFDNSLNYYTNDFSKYISNYCTVYQDFDSHSEDYNSYIVIYN
jgi:hypothetical protein